MTAATTQAQTSSDWPEIKAIYMDGIQTGQTYPTCRSAA